LLSHITALFSRPCTLPIFKYTNSPTIFITRCLWNSISDVDNTSFHALRISKSPLFAIRCHASFEGEQIITAVWTTTPLIRPFVAHSLDWTT
jgi:hypothetical protein